MSWTSSSSKGQGQSHTERDALHPTNQGDFALCSWGGCSGEKRYYFWQEVTCCILLGTKNPERGAAVGRECQVHLGWGKAFRKQETFPKGPETTHRKSQKVCLRDTLGWRPPFLPIHAGSKGGRGLEHEEGGDLRAGPWGARGGTRVRSAPLGKPCC